ncbi:MAG: zinc metallopeptidase [Hyphomicrobiaceae bacterium]|nr:zinc metallopeptidase [Hyphomicrobiaceae bacterium]
MLFAIIALVVILGLAVLPQLWVRSVIARHAAPRSDFPGTGGELARHLLDGMKLHGVRVEETTLGDHYDPDAKTVRLLPQHMHGRSLSAVVIAAHEVGHAMQDASGYAPLAARTKLARQAQRVELIGTVVMLASPLMVLLLKAPALMAVQIFAGLLILSFTILMHAVTLPVEFDASFKRALPLLEAGEFIPPEDVPKARELLRAAAFTYVAAAAMSLINIARWLRVIRF